MHTEEEHCHLPPIAFQTFLRQCENSQFFVFLLGFILRA